MIPSDWIVHERDDGERLGYLIPEGDHFVRWRLDVADRADPIDVEIVEVDPDGLVVKNVDFGYERDYGTRIRLEVPVTDGLRPA